MITKKTGFLRHYKIKQKRVKFKRNKFISKNKHLYKNCKHFGIDDLPF
jgi:hypothetical protein